MTSVAFRSEAKDVESAMSPIVTTNFFECMRVNDRALLAQVYRTRYQVYCVERKLIDGSAYADSKERDEFDAHAAHVLARHRNGEAAGTARLILPSPLGFPCQNHCQFFGDFSYLGDRSSERLATYSEVSRLAISKAFRRRSGDTFYGGDPRPRAAHSRNPCGHEPPNVLVPGGPEILLAILKCLYQETKLLGLTHWLIAVERSLHLLLQRMGWPFVAVGPQVDYHGFVRPYVAEVSHAERVLQRKNPKLLNFLRQGLPRVRDGVDAHGSVTRSGSLRIVGS